MLVDLLHRHLRGDGAHRVDEAALDEIAQALRVERAVAERARGGRDRLGGRNDAQEEFDDHLDPHAVAGDERAFARAPHLDAQGVHADFGDVVDDRQHQRAAAHHHFLAAKSGSHEGEVLRGMAIKPVQKIDDDGDDNRRENDDGDNISAVHGDISSTQNRTQRECAESLIAVASTASTKAIWLIRSARL